MFDPIEIEQAKILFKNWDLNNIWHKSTPEFAEHTRIKAKEALNLALYLLNKITQTKELEEYLTTTVWIVTLSYYSMFFEAEYLFSVDNRKLPSGTKDTHKTIYLAFLYYYVIKSSELEQNKTNSMTTSRMSKALVMFKEIQDEALELQRIERSVHDFKTQREQRHAFTYRMNRSAEIDEAENSILKATKFRELVEEYLISRQRR